MTKKALIVDDNPSNGLVAQFLLEELGVESDVVHSGREGLLQLEKNPYDVMLLDWMMPGMDGIQVLEAMKEKPEADGIKVILCTAKAGKSDQQFALNTGAHDFLSKPLTLDSVRQSLTNVGILKNPAA